MAQLSDDCFAFGGDLMSAADALKSLESRLAPITSSQKIPLAKAAGRFLAQDVVAGMSVPPHDNSAVDGYGVYFDDLEKDGETRLPVTGRVTAGHPLGGPARRGEAVRIFTGAPMPFGEGPSGESNGGPDTILMEEDCTRQGDEVIIPPGIKKGANRRKSGEDITCGDVILEKGKRLRPQDIGLAASVGTCQVSVYAPLKVALFSTGDELRDPQIQGGEELAPGTVYDANRYTLIALLENIGCEVSDLGILPDTREDIRNALEKAAGDHQVILTSGGVSAGEEDHVRDAVTALGAIHFWRLAVKPGRPVAFGQIGDTVFMGLPGNPVAVMVMFLVFARPALFKLSGGIVPALNPFQVRAGFSYKKKKGRREWVRATLLPDADGQMKAEKFARGGAGILSSLVAADGLVELAEDITNVQEGDGVPFLPFSGLLT